jgi:hypothetical protein
MTITSAAHSATPKISCKPSEVRRSLTDSMTTGCDAEAAQLKHYSRWVKESMGVGTLYYNFMIPAGHRPAALPAINSFNRVKAFFFLFIPYRLAKRIRPTGLITPPPVVSSKTIDSVSRLSENRHFFSNRDILIPVLCGG